MTTEPSSDPGAAVEAVAADAERVRRRELSTALRAMEADGDLPPDQREAVERLAGAVVGGVLGGPLRRLAAGDEATAGRALELFDLAEPPATGAGTEAGATGVSGGD
jgi:glutamyl-tRNA reductase